MTVAFDTKYTLNGWLIGSAGDFAYGNVVTVSSFRKTRRNARQAS